MQELAVGTSEWYYQNSFKEIQLQRIATHEKSLQAIWAKRKYREHSQPVFPVK